MKLLICDLFMAILNMLSFLINDNAIGYANLVVGCLLFICAGMNLRRVIDKKLDEKLDDKKNQ